MTNLAFIPANELSFTTVERERQRLLAFCRKVQAPILTLDLNDINHCDGAGLAFLIEAKRLAKAHHKECLILGMNENIHALAEFYGVESLLDTI